MAPCGRVATFPPAATLSREILQANKQSYHANYVYCLYPVVRNKLLEHSNLSLGCKPNKFQYSRWSRSPKYIRPYNVDNGNAAALSVYTEPVPVFEVVPIT
ncbi:hypothetical protein J6590_010016 [Homalodisca vitripennis]|nr:hypothetical protein J6590_010016 [Homalodisca vitripennis]